MMTEHESDVALLDADSFSAEGTLQTRSLGKSLDPDILSAHTRNPAEDLDAEVDGSFFAQAAKRKARDEEESDEEEEEK